MYMYIQTKKKKVITHDPKKILNIVKQKNISYVICDMKDNETTTCIYQVQMKWM